MGYALLLVLLAAGVAACTSTKPPTPLTKPETVALLHEIFNLVEVADEGTSTVDCSVGGEATLTTTFDEGEDRDSIWGSGRWVIVPADCEADVVSDTLTLTGKPDLNLTMNLWAVLDDDFEVVEGELKIAMTGAMTWRRRNGDSDACSVDLAFEDTGWDGYELTGDLTGGMCGLDLAIDINELF